MRIYVYGIIDSDAPILEPISGLEGVCIYNLAYRDIGAVVSKLINHTFAYTSGVSQNNTINRDDVLKHEEVVERLMDNFTVLPVKFFTTFNQEEEVLVMLKEYYQDFKENLDRLRDKVEFGIRVIWPSETIKNRIIEAAKKFNPSTTLNVDGERGRTINANVTIPDSSPGKNFAKEKFENYKIDKELTEEADRCIAFLDDFFSRFAAEKKLEKLKSNNLLLNAYYLVEKEKQADFKEAFERTRSTPGDLKFLLSGPWPPYNFIVLTKNADMFNRKPTNQNLAGKNTL